MQADIALGKTAVTLQPGKNARSAGWRRVVAVLAVARWRWCGRYSNTRHGRHDCQQSREGRAEAANERRTVRLTLDHFRALGEAIRT